MLAIRRGLVGAVVLAASFAAFAQESYPNKPVQLVYPYGAGGSDVLYRAMARAMSAITGQQHVFINREGAAGAIGASSVARAAPDGHTVMVSPSLVVTNLPHVQKDIGYDVDSFEYVCQVAVNAIALNVRKDSPFQNLGDLVAAAKAAPGKLAFDHLGRFTDMHLNMILLSRRAGIEVTDVPYRGDNATLLALLAGDLAFSVNSAISTARRDEFRALAVLWDRRHPAMPNVPTAQEQGYTGFFAGQQGLFAPKGTPRAVLQRIEQTCARAVQADEFKAVAATQNAAIVYQNGEEFGRAVRADFKTKGDLIRSVATPEK